MPFDTRPSREGSSYNYSFVGLVQGVFHPHGSKPGVMSMGLSVRPPRFQCRESPFPTPHRKSTHLFSVPLACAGCLLFNLCCQDSTEKGVHMDIPHIQMLGSIFTRDTPL